MSGQVTFDREGIKRALGLTLEPVLVMALGRAGAGDGPGAQRRKGRDRRDSGRRQPRILPPRRAALCAEGEGGRADHSTCMRTAALTWQLRHKHRLSVKRKRAGRQCVAPPQYYPSAKQADRSESEDGTRIVVVCLESLGSEAEAAEVHVERFSCRVDVTLSGRPIH